MLTRLKSGLVFDPVHGRDGTVCDLYLRDGRIVPPPAADVRVDAEIDLKGRVVMAGAIDIHTHIGGGKVNIGRTLLPEDHRTYTTARSARLRSGSGRCSPSTLITGYQYAQMGYTACFEPAMLPINARHAHLEMADTPMVDKGAYALLGSDDFLLRAIRDGMAPERIRDYVAWILHASQALAIKVVNPGGISAFKFNQRRLDLDEAHVHYGVTPRQVLQTLAGAVHDLGLSHPLHVHGCNLGVPGNLETTLKTIDAVDGLPLHLTHIQFHSYGTEGDRGFSSGAARIAEAVNAHSNLSIDVGQIMFGQTITESGDSMRQLAGASHADPDKWVVMDIECEAGCGVVPFRYRDRSYVNALQWAIGLELFLLCRDPWRIFLTTDHPNGAPFTTYPHLIRLLMDRTFRNDMLARINRHAAAASTLASIEREYTLYEIAIMTRAAPARSLGLLDRGHLGPGAVADITVYRPNADRERMFATPEYVFKNGQIIARNGRVTQVVHGATHVARPDYDRAIEDEVRQHFERFHTTRMENVCVGDEEIVDDGRGAIVVQPGRGRSR